MSSIARTFGFGTEIGTDSQRLYWAMSSLAIALLPHLTQIPLWISLLIGVVVLWRVVIEMYAWRLPPRWLRIIIAITAMAAVAVTFRTLNGLEAGTALLATMGSMKLLETRGARDCTMLVFIGYVLLFAALLYDQSLAKLPYILAAAWLLTASLLRVHQAARGMQVRAALRTTAKILLQGLPVAVLLFVFFPRIPGQFWALPARNSATTGLSDEMSPGDISELTISYDPAFRVKFAGTAPPQAERYWRGPVLHEFDGRRWRRPPFASFAREDIVADGTPFSYRVTMEPTQRPWLFALDVPTEWPAQAFRTFDLQLITRQPITSLASFELQSHTRYRTPPTLPRSMRILDTALPGSANPRMRVFARELRATTASDLAFVESILAKFQREEFFYTLTPPSLGDDAVDDFLFNSRKGFCEHFASAFTALMRAADIPARVVTGYQGGEFNSLGEYILVRQSDAHAWSEVWLEDRGWVRVDPTAAVAPQRTERNLDAAISAKESVPGRFLRQNLLLARARLTWDAVNNFWNDRIVQYNELKQRSLMALLGIKDSDWRDLGVAITLTLALFFVGLTGILGWQYRPRKTDPVAAAFDRLCRKLTHYNVIRERHEGPVDYLRRAVAIRPDLTVQLGEMQTLYTNLRYGPTPTAEDLQRLKTLVRRLSA